MNHWNKNGLINGAVPAGNACPFIATCKYRLSKCPTDTALHDKQYSCSVARLLSLSKMSHPEVASEVNMILEKVGR